MGNLPMSWASASGRIIARAVSVPDLVMRTAGYDGATEASVQQSAAEGALHDPRGMTLPDVGWPAASAVSRVIRGHDARVPGVDSMQAFLQAAAEFVVADLELQAEPSAAAGLALEWPDDLAPAMAAFLAGDTLADHPQLWFGDVRITAGHLAVPAERAGAGPLELTLFDGTMGADWSWSRRDEAMAAHILAGRAGRTRTLVVAGNAHTPISRAELGVPIGAYLAQRGPGVREIHINYCSGILQLPACPVRHHRPAAAPDTALPAR